MSFLGLSELDRKLDPNVGGVPDPNPLLGGVPKLLGGTGVDVPGVVPRMAGGLLGITVPGLMAGALSAGTPITPVPGGGTVVRGVRMLLNPRGAVVLGVEGYTTAGAVVPGTVL